MATPAEWLERLSQATNYRDLQVVFSEMAASARTAADGGQLAATIDEAIRRLERERLRDEQELEDFQRDYDQFKEQQQGVVGWFKRHMPLTQTRKQEIEHRDTISDQRAEILADNLVIARAQMIKEQLLPPDSRRLGHKPYEWTARLDSQQTVAHLAAYAASIRALTDELAHSRTFVEQLQADIEAFKAAAFTSKEDRQRKDADLSAARNELAALRAEITDEESLRATAVQRLGQLVEDELSQNDAAFRDLRARLQSLRMASQRSEETHAAAQELHGALSHLLELERERRDVPSEREQLERLSRQLRGDVDDAQRAYAAAAAELTQVDGKYQEATRHQEQARSALAAAKRLYDAYLQQQGKAEVEPEDPFANESPLETEYLRLQQELQQAEERLRAVNAPYDAAKQRAEDAQCKAQSLQQQLDDTQQKQQALVDKENRLQHDIAVANDRLQPALERLKSLADRYREAMQSLPWQTVLPSLDGMSLPPMVTRTLPDRRSWPSSQERNRSSENFGAESMADLERFLEALREQHGLVDRDLAACQESRNATWTRRCHQLFDTLLAKEVCGG